MSGFWKDTLSALAVLFLIFLNGFFVAAEFALVSVRKTRIEQLANEGHRAAMRVHRALMRLNTYIAGTQLGVTMAALALGSVGEAAIARILLPPFARILPVHSAFFSAHAIALTLAFVIVTALDIVLGELVPKSVALQHGENVILRLIGPLELFIGLFKPFIYLLNVSGTGVLRLMGLEPVGEQSTVHSVEELELLVHSSRQAGVLQVQQEQMVSGVFDFEDTPVQKLMTSRLDITAIALDIHLEELICIVTDSGHSRFPVYEDNLDNIVGVLHVKDALKRIMTGTLSGGIRELMRPPYFIPENKRAGYLLAEMRRKKFQMAIVRDEYGTTTGIVTLEDLLEEIVGDIQDEYDREEPNVRFLDDTTILLDGKMSLVDVNDRLDLDLETEGVHTIGGFVFNLLGHQASQGEGATWENLTFSVEETDGRRITKVRLIRPPTLPLEEEVTEGTA